VLRSGGGGVVGCYREKKMKTTRDLEEMRDVLNEARMSLNVLLRKKK
jgi:hypothetical protein